MSYIQPVRASGTIYIRANGLVEGTDKIVTADNVTYTFADNISDSIVVERDNIIVDGAGHSVTGSWSGNGIALTDRSSVTIRNMAIKDFTYGIYLDSSSNNILSGNNVTNNGDGIDLLTSSGNALSGNNIANNNYGVVLESSSSNNSIFHNKFANNNQVFSGGGLANFWDDGYPSGATFGVTTMEPTKTTTE